MRQDQEHASGLPDHQTVVSLLEKALNQGQNPTLTVISNSMAPLLERGDLVTLSKLNFETLKKELTFQRCNVYGSGRSLPPGKNYEGGGKAIKDHFYTRYKAPKDVKESGLVFRISLF